MNRFEVFQSFFDHPMQASLMKKLTKAEMEMCVHFLVSNEGLSDDDFMIKVNRWMLDQERPKHHTTMWALVSQTASYRKALG